ncbi:MAG: hypothetical protein ABIE74_03345 [Pseudomonadota bacterium]
MQELKITNCEKIIDDLLSEIARDLLQPSNASNYTAPGFMELLFEGGFDTSLVKKIVEDHGGEAVGSYHLFAYIRKEDDLLSQSAKRSSALKNNIIAQAIRSADRLTLQKYFDHILGNYFDEGLFIAQEDFSQLLELLYSDENIHKLGVLALQLGYDKEFEKYVLDVSGSRDIWVGILNQPDLLMMLSKFSEKVQIAIKKKLSKIIIGNHLESESLDFQTFNRIIYESTYGYESGTIWQQAFCHPHLLIDEMLFQKLISATKDKEQRLRLAIFAVLNGYSYPDRDGLISEAIEQISNFCERSNEPLNEILDIANSTHLLFFLFLNTISYDDKTGQAKTLISKLFSKSCADPYTHFKDPATLSKVGNNAGLPFKFGVESNIDNMEYLRGHLDKIIETFNEEQSGNLGMAISNYSHMAERSRNSRMRILNQFSKLIWRLPEVERFKYVINLLKNSDLMIIPSRDHDELFAILHWFTHYINEFGTLEYNNEFFELLFRIASDGRTPTKDRYLAVNLLYVMGGQYQNELNKRRTQLEAETNDQKITPLTISNVSTFHIINSIESYYRNQIPREIKWVVQGLINKRDMIRRTSGQLPLRSLRESITKDLLKYKHILSKYRQNNPAVDELMAMIDKFTKLFQEAIDSEWKISSPLKPQSAIYSNGDELSKFLKELQYNLTKLYKEKVSIGKVEDPLTILEALVEPIDRFGSIIDDKAVEELRLIPNF